MATTTIGKKTLEDLKKLIDEAIDRRLRNLLGEFKIREGELFSEEQPDTRTWDEVRRDIERDRWTPPPGAKSSLELLREDRDS